MRLALSLNEMLV